MYIFQMTSRTKKKKKAVPTEKKPTASVDIPDWEKLQSQINIIIASVSDNTISLHHLQKDVLETFGYNLHDAAQNYEYSSIQEMLSDMTEAVQIKHTHMGVMVSAAVVDASAHVTEMIKKTKSKKSRRPNSAPMLRRPGYPSFRPASSKAPHRSFGHPSTRGGSFAQPSTRGGNSAHHSTRGGNSAHHSTRGGSSAHHSTRGGSSAHHSTRGGSSTHRPSYNEAPRRVPVYDSHFFENSAIRPLPSSGLRGNPIRPSSLSGTRRFTSSDGTQLQSSIPSQTSSVRPSPSVDLLGNPIRTPSSSGIQSFTSSVGTQPQSYISSPIPLGPPPSKSSSVCPSSFGDTYYVQNSALSGTRRFTSSVSTEPQPSITSSISMAPAPSQNSSICPTSSDGLDGNSIRPSASNGTRRFTSSVGTEPSSSNSSLISFGPPLSETSAVRFASTGAIRLPPSGNSTQPLPLNGTRRFTSSLGIQSQSSTTPSTLSFGSRSSQSSTVRLTSFGGFSAVPQHDTSFAKSCSEKPKPVSTQQSAVQLWQQQQQRLLHNRNGAASSRTQPAPKASESAPRASESANQTLESSVCESESSRIVSPAPSVRPAPMPRHDSLHKPPIPPRMLSRSEALLYEKKILADYIDKVCFKSAIPQN
uniref:Uncharacterized protein n=1 Tax=Panagrolaimus davidi TaxID=227884 RepID=A0A914Q065_9BILA